MTCIRTTFSELFYINVRKTIKGTTNTTTKAQRYICRWAFVLYRIRIGGYDWCIRIGLYLDFISAKDCFRPLQITWNADLKNSATSQISWDNIQLQWTAAIVQCHRSPKMSSKSERILSRTDTVFCQWKNIVKQTDWSGICKMRMPDFSFHSAQLHTWTFVTLPKAYVINSNLFHISLTDKLNNDKIITWMKC